MFILPFSIIIFFFGILYAHLVEVEAECNTCALLYGLVIYSMHGIRYTPIRKYLVGTYVGRRYTEFRM